MVRHDAKRKNPNPAVGFVTPHQFYKSFLLQLAQNKVPVYHSGNTMVVSDLHRSLGLESRAPHTPLATDATGKRFYPSVCPLRFFQVAEKCGLGGNPQSGKQTHPQGFQAALCRSNISLEGGLLLWRNRQELVAGLLDPYLPNRQAETVALCFNDATSFFEAFSADSAVQSLDNRLRWASIFKFAESRASREPHFIFPYF